MATFIYPVLGGFHKSLNNIPRNIGSGYGGKSSGKVKNKNGTFLFYGSVFIEGKDGAIDYKNEIDACWSAKFTELPCDAEGNILMISHFFSADTIEGIGDVMRIMILCAEEPTHRVNLTTGVITDNSTDNTYLKTILLSYVVYDRRGV
ncbi:hypothetical protein M2263_000152 [Providencia alcalifaciens]|nr:hypothetical protein [Providencia alcalifaciens]